VIAASLINKLTNESKSWIPILQYQGVPVRAAPKQTPAASSSTTTESKATPADAKSAPLPKKGSLEKSVSFQKKNADKCLWID